MSNETQVSEDRMKRIAREDGVADWLMGAVIARDGEALVTRTSWGKFTLVASGGRTFRVSVEEV